MNRSASEILREYLAAQAADDVDAALRWIADDAVFDVGRGRYTGAREIRAFHERLRAVHSRTRLVELRDAAEARAVAIFEQRDDDLAPLGIDHLRLDVEIEVAAGRVTRFTARPTPESIRALTAAREGGHTSEGLRLAEQAGTVPPKARG